MIQIPVRTVLPQYNDLYYNLRQVQKYQRKRVKHFSPRH